MLYVNENIPSSYHYLVSVSDNYYVLSNTSYVEGDYANPSRINVYYCFLNPSFASVRSTLSYNYSTTFTDVSSQLTNDLHYAPDFPLILLVSLILCFFITLLYNGITRLIRPHGIVF